MISNIRSSDCCSARFLVGSVFLLGFITLMG
jgi:hypothetical protein